MGTKDRSAGAAGEQSGSGKLVALFEATISGTQLRGSIGGAEPATLPAVIQSGGCKSRQHDDDRRHGKKRKG
ncbi:MAG TPA: hypothetical protein VH968_05940 [Gaiellaceae bacterium]|jgi:hypothetical protein